MRFTIVTVMTVMVITDMAITGMATIGAVTIILIMIHGDTIGGVGIIGAGHTDGCRHVMASDRNLRAVPVAARYASAYQVVAHHAHVFVFQVMAMVQKFSFIVGKFK